MNESKISGFDPKKYLRKMVNEAGEPVMRLELPYQKLWFRQTYPCGRMVLNPLRLTDQLAIFEAKVFFQKDDPAPVSSFTANKTALETPGYIRAAQDEALSEALENAGFGFLMYGIDGAADQELPPVQKTEPKPTEQAIQATAQTAPPAHETVQRIEQEAPQSQSAPRSTQLQTGKQAIDTAASANAGQTVQPAMRQTEPEQQPKGNTPVPERTPAQTVQQAASPAQPDQEPEPQPDYGQRSTVGTLLDFPQTDGQPANGLEHANAAMSATADAFPTPADTAGREDTPPQADPSYTEDMSVEDICKRMTLEEARGVVVQRGPCAGWPMAQVAERRFSSLRFYQNQFCDYSNIIKAAATLLLQDAEQKKAG